MLSFGALASKVFGSSNDRKLKKYGPIVDKINALEAETAALSDEALKARTEEFRARVREGTDIDDLIPEAFATVREAAKRTLGQRHFDVQLIGGIVLHEGRIAEMKTGEGKTLVATLPVYLNALTGRGVHVVTVNDYLAKRDAAWMGAIYKFLGLTVGCIVHELNDQQRYEQYACDVTYGTNNEFGFDYLRDNMKYISSEMVQRGHVFAIVDEVDSILIDEARTPLIISGPLDDRSELYKTIDTFIPKLEAGDYELDEKTRVVTLTEAGNERIEKLLGEAGLLKGESLYDIDNVSVVHHVQQALRAYTLFKYGRDYTRKRGEVIIIDEFTGRMMQGRRYSEGLHQALEAKEARIVEAKIAKRAGIQSPLDGNNDPSQRNPEPLAESTTRTVAAEHKRDVVQGNVVAANDDAWRKRMEEEIRINAKEKAGRLFKAIVEAETESRWDNINPDRKARWEKIKPAAGISNRKAILDAKQPLSILAVAAACGTLVCMASVVALLMFGESMRIGYGAGIISVSLLAAFGSAWLMNWLATTQSERLVKKVKNAWETNQWKNIAPAHRRLWERVRTESDSDRLFRQIIESDIRNQWDGIHTHYRKLWAGIKSESYFEELNRPHGQFDRVDVNPEFKELWMQMEAEADAEADRLVEHVVKAYESNQWRNLPPELKKLSQKSQAYVERDKKEATIRESKRFEEEDDLEPVVIQPENQTFATITFQNYFRLYEKLAGMTGTAATEADEFMETYGLDVVEVPTNMPMIREDEDDEVYRTKREKLNAIANLIQDCTRRGQPILAGTTSIENSKELSDVLNKKGIHHQVLNARYHDIEATIIAEAGRRGAVTIATNMAGRGTDIQLGGNPDVRFKVRLKGQVPEEDIARISAEAAALDHSELEQTAALLKRVVRAAAANEWANIEPRYKSLWEDLGAEKAGTIIDSVPKDMAEVHVKSPATEAELRRRSQLMWIALFIVLTAGVLGIGYAVGANMLGTLVVAAAVNLFTYFAAGKLIEWTAVSFWPTRAIGVIEPKQSANFGIIDKVDAEAEAERLTKLVLEAKDKDRLENIEPRYRDLWQKVSAEVEAGRGVEPDKSALVTPAQIKLWREIKEEVRRDKRRVIDAGGLYVVGTERHESRRIDNQLRGRSGRQGDPGRSRFFLSLEDDLMRIFGSERMDGMLQALGLKEDEAIVHPWINKALEKAQGKVEARNFDLRKNLLKYDNVMNDQRKAIFEQRRELLSDADVSETVADMRHQVIDDLVATHIPEKSYPEQWDLASLKEAMAGIFDLDLPLADWAAEEGIGDAELHERLMKAADEKTAKKAADIGPQIMRQIERAVLLQTLDNLWREHLVTLDHLRQVVGLRGYGQRDPLNEYKSESFTLFEHMLARLREGVTGQLAHVELAKPDEVPPLEGAELPPMEAHHANPITGENEFALETANAGGNGRGAAKPARARKVADVNPADPSTWGKVQRNALCPCGSGKKFKHCHGAF